MEWLEYHKKKWELQRGQRKERGKMLSQASRGGDLMLTGMPSTSSAAPGSLSGMLRQRNRGIVELPWQLIQVRIVQCTLGYCTAVSLLLATATKA